MAGNDERLTIDIEARISQLEKDMSKAQAIANKAYAGMKRDSGSATRQMEQDMLRSTGRINQALAATSLKVGGYGKAFAFGLGSGVLSALAPIALFTKALETINDASHLVDTADKIGLTTTALQELSFGFSQAGVDQSAFETGMEQFSKRIGEAATRGGKLADILKANGVALRDGNGQIKSSEQLLGSYADLIKNATSEQEKMLLVTEAFGRGGGDMLVGLNDGAQGILNMKKAAQDAGGVIDEQLLRRAEEMGDRWDATWRRFKVNSQSAILTAVEGMDDLAARFADFEKRRAAAELGTMAGSLVPKPGDVLTTGKAGKPDTLDARMAGPLTETLDAADQKLIDALKVRYGAATQKATVIPAAAEKGRKSSGRNAEMEAALREAEAVQKLIATLQEELNLVDASDAQKRISAELRRANVAATSAEGQQIAALVTQIEAETEARERQKEAQEAQTEALNNLFEMGADALTGIAEGSLKAGDAVKKLATELALAAIQAMLLGSGPLAGLFGGGGLGSLFGGGGGGGIPWADDTFRAGGGPVNAGQAYIVGEKRPEVFVPDRAGTILPSIAPPPKSGGADAKASQAAPISLNFSPVYNVTGTTEDIDRLRQQMAKDRHEFEAKTVAAVRKAQKTRAL